MRIALTGNPNSGKTTMYNALTGRTEKVGNWAGVTVDKKEHRIKSSYCKQNDLIAVDLPGAYSMSPFTSEESITSEYIKKEAPDVIINIVDASNLSRSLFFTTQLLELGIPVVVALNKYDINRKKGTHINEKLLSEKLGCPVVKTVSTSSAGLPELVKIAVMSAGKEQIAPYTPKKIITDRASSEDEDRSRYNFVNGLINDIERRSLVSAAKDTGDKADSLLTNKWLGLPIFAAVMFLVFQISQVWVGPLIADSLTELLENFQSWMAERFADASPLLSAILVDGIVGGVIAVLSFLPLVMVMYFLIALLEDCGYMSRAAVVLDPIFKRVGLSGKSVIPFVIGIGCSVPGIMASRTIKDERERRAAVMLAPMMPCGAKIPLIALFAGAFFDDAGWVSALMYFSGIALIFFGALIINAITGVRRKHLYFIIELPDYKLPSLVGAFRSMCSRGWAYIVKASTIILLCNTAVQLMQTFDWTFHTAEAADSSILASIARPFAYLLIPIVGVVSWQLAAAVVTGFIAKENVVGTLAVCFVGLQNLINTEELALAEGAASQVAGIMGITKVAALAYLMFNLYSPPCFAAIGAMNSEMKSKKWVIGAIAFQLSVGYTVGYFVYTIGTLITSPSSLNVEAAFAGLVFEIFIFAAIAYLIRNNNKTVSKKYAVGEA